MCVFSLFCVACAAGGDFWGVEEDEEENKAREEEEERERERERNRVIKVHKDVKQKSDLWEPTIGSIHYIQNSEFTSKSQEYPRKNEAIFHSVGCWPLNIEV